MSKLGNLLQIQDYFTEIQKETMTRITMWITGCKFNDDEQRFLAEEICFISTIRPQATDLLSTVLCNMLHDENFKTFKKYIINELLNERQFIFLRKILITGAIEFSEIEDRIVNEGRLFFAPEFSLFDDYTDFEEHFEVGFPMDSLGFAIKYDNEKAMENMIKDNLNLNVEWCVFEPVKKPFEDVTPLEASALFGSKRCFSKLIEKGAKITDRVIQCAIIGGNKSILSQVDASQYIELALKYRRGDLLSTCYDLSFIQCLKNRHYSAAVMAFDREPNKIHKDGAALHYAVMQNCIPFVSFLISNECDVNLQTTNEKKTALHFAVFQQNYTITQILLENNAISLQDVNGDTPLHIAVRKNDGKLCKMLMDHGMDPEIKNNLGLSPISIAKENRNFEIYGMLSITK